MADPIKIESIVSVPTSELVSSVKTPGQLLREARLIANQTDAEIASRLYLSRGIIRALEEDDYAKLPGLSFARGYLRAYARIVGISEPTIMSAFTALKITKNQTPTTAFPMTHIKKQVTANDKSVRWITYLIITVLASLMVIWWRNHDDKIEDVTAVPLSPTVDVSPVPSSTNSEDAPPFTSSENTPPSTSSEDASLISESKMSSVEHETNPSHFRSIIDLSDVVPLKFPSQ